MGKQCAECGGVRENMQIYIGRPYCMWCYDEKRKESDRREERMFRANKEALPWVSLKN